MPERAAPAAPKADTLLLVGCGQMGSAMLRGWLARDAVVFAVKPQIINDVLPAFRRWVRPQTLFLSIAAGITISGIARHLGEAAIIRTMPNTPAPSAGASRSPARTRWS